MPGHVSVASLSGLCFHASTLSALGSFSLSNGHSWCCHMPEAWCWKCKPTHEIFAEYFLDLLPLWQLYYKDPYERTECSLCMLDSNHTDLMELSLSRSPLPTKIWVFQESTRRSRAKAKIKLSQALYLTQHLMKFPNCHLHFWCMNLFTWLNV